MLEWKSFEIFAALQFALMNSPHSRLIKMNGCCFLCGNSPAPLKCSKCEEIKACSTECFGVHDDNEAADDEPCRAFKMEQNDQVGRFLVATRPIKDQDIVLIDPPLLMAPQSLPVCLMCLSKCLTTTSLYWHNLFSLTN